jgi:hypothetical protein
MAGGGDAECGRQVGLPVPGGPRSTMLRASLRNAPEASAPTWLRTAGWASKSKSSRVLRAGNPAQRIRISAPEAFLIDTDRAKMLPLPPVPLHLGWRERVRLGRDYYVRLDTSDYSVDPTAIGRMVDVSADLDQVRIRLDGRIVADHARLWAAAPRSPTRRTARQPGSCANSSASPAPISLSMTCVCPRARTPTLGTAE